MNPLAEVEALTVEDHAGRTVLDDVSLTVAAGEAVGVVGESGSGKTTTALTLLGWVRHGLRVVSGRVRVAGTDLVGRPEREIRAARGRLVGYVPQSPASALSPLMRVGDQIAETLTHLPADERAARVAETLELVELPGEEEFRRKFPHQLSGGQQQRLCLAVALANRPRVLVLDEPTTGLDVITQAAVLAQVDRIRRDLGVGVLLVSHDLALVAAHTDRVVMMYRGRVVEEGPSRSMLARPAHEYTRGLVAAVVDHRARRAAAEAPSGGAAPLLAVKDLTAVHRVKGREVVAADGVSFEVRAGECLAVVGQSGSGKTTIARAVAGLHRADAGTILLDGSPLPPTAHARGRDQLRRIQLVFQDPFASLNPRRTVGDSVGRPLRVLRGMSRSEARAEVARLLDRVRIRADAAAAYPGELSGGECQRVAIARGLASAPDLLVCDEITSALDVSVQAAVLELINELRRDLGLALLFISHDLGAVSVVADTIMVVERGRCREYGPAAEVLHTPRDAYTRRLVEAAPSLSDALVASAPTGSDDGLETAP
ncbi:ABC transporter ATP-binding protein [Actinomadura chibensis]|uniref:ABC transporter ATP-binding protein n=1 Tax=Actinomadura chibensis TaxID=392828 RepID=A0A5D0NUJ9_9ACTN|nr:ABC transporter ATP-binding protein [Actinomadura chibensis]TYB48186.1 ABC transporter ATP-binding protein [Actinomadura chibensis]